MKYDPIYNQEKTIEHYDKKKLLWHGTMVYTRDDNQAYHINYYDNISSGDSK